MEIRSLQDIKSDCLYEAFKEAFIDYEMQLTGAELGRMLQRRGFNENLSFGAFDAGRLVAFTFNGVGNHMGVPTVYDTGTGTIKSHRGHGLTGKIFQYSLPHLQNAGYRQYLLEVLQHNDKAVSVYKKLGFRVSREFYYHIQHGNRINCQDRKLDPEYMIRPIPSRDLADIVDFDEIEASWQNSFESVSRAFAHFKSKAVYYLGKLVAYCIYEPQSGDLTRISVSPAHRRNGIGTNLLKHVIRENRHENLKVINVPLNEHGFHDFLLESNISPAGKQYEMKLDI